MEHNLEKVKNLTEQYVGGLENQMSDYEEGTEEYEEAKAFFDQPKESQIEEIYEAIINDIEKEVRFAGKDTIKFLIGHFID